MREKAEASEASSEASHSLLMKHHYLNLSNRNSNSLEGNSDLTWNVFFILKLGKHTSSVIIFCQIPSASKSVASLTDPWMKSALSLKPIPHSFSFTILPKVSQEPLKGQTSAPPPLDFQWWTQRRVAERIPRSFIFLYSLLVQEINFCFIEFFFFFFGLFQMKKIGNGHLKYYLGLCLQIISIFIYMYMFNLFRDYFNHDLWGVLPFPRYFIHTFSADPLD